MYIHSKPAAAFYKLVVGAISLFLEWFILSQYGWTALRFFSTWVLFLAAIYYLSSALFLATSHEKSSGKNPCPMLEGMIITAFWLISGTVIAAQAQGFTLPELPAWLMIVIAGILPVLTLLDWILFVKKGRFKIMMPFYWLALPACYAATMIFTAQLLPESTLYRYPLAMFNYFDFGLYEMFLVMLIVAIIYLAVGYAWYLLDFALSGKLAKKIVMIHVRTVEPVEPSAAPEIEIDSAKPADNASAIVDDLKSSTEPEIERAADEALEELKEFAKKSSNETPVESIETVEIETIEIATEPDPVKTSDESSSTSYPHPTSNQRKAKPGKAMDIEVIRDRFNGNKSSHKASQNAKSSNNNYRNNPKNRNSKSNNSHNSRKKKSKKHH